MNASTATREAELHARLISLLPAQIVASCDVEAPASQPTQAPAVSLSGRKAATRKATRRYRETGTEFDAFARRMIRAYGRRVATEDPSVLANMLRLRDELDAAIDSAVTELHGRGFSWTEIGQATGMHRNHAWRRWGKGKGQAE